MRWSSRGWVRTYAEKPVHRFQVSSALYVVGPEVAASIDPGSGATSRTLVARLLEKEWPVAAFPTRQLLGRRQQRPSHAEAEELVRRRQVDFEQWRDEPDTTVFLPRSTSGRELCGPRGGPCGPVSGFVVSSGSIQCRGPGFVTCQVSRRYGARGKTATFDDLDVISGRVVSTPSTHARSRTALRQGGMTGCPCPQGLFAPRLLLP